jgi:ABC-type glycerol-3-phosphate transport system permease component
VDEDAVRDHQHRDRFGSAISLMAGALVGSLPPVVMYAFFVEYIVSAMTGAVKE